MENDRENSFFHILILYRFLPFLSPYLLAHTICLFHQNLYPCILAVMLQTLDFPFLQYTTCCAYDIIDRHTTTNNIYQFQLIQTTWLHVSTRILVIICLVHYTKNKNYNCHFILWLDCNLNCSYKIHINYLWHITSGLWF